MDYFRNDIKGGVLNPDTRIFFSWGTNELHSNPGLRTVEAFGVRNRFFHFEFFRLDEDKRGLGKRGDIIGLEVNMRAPGGYIPDKMNFAYNVDVYQIWAEMLVYGENRSFANWSFRRYVPHFGSSEQVDYRHTADEICQALADRLLIERVPPKSIAGGMGAQVFIAWRTRKIL